MRGQSLRRVGRAVGNGFRVAYDRTGMTILLSVAWFIFVFIPLSFIFFTIVNLLNMGGGLGVGDMILGFLVLVFWAGPVTATIYSVAGKLLAKEHFEWRDLGRLFKQHYGSSAKLTAVMFTLLIILLIDINFFLTSELSLMVYIGFVFLWLLLFWFLIFQYVYPVAVKEKRTVLETLKVSSLLVLDNLLVSLSLLAVGIVWIYISVLLKVLPVLFMAGTLAMIHASGFETLLLKYRKESDASDDADENRERE